MLRRLIISLFVVIAIISINSAEAQTTIVGQNNPAVDIQAVQSAVNQGGSILLIGTFDFGLSGSVKITGDVKIHGETDNQGNPLTHILGGRFSLHAPLPLNYIPFNGPDVTIEGINFSGATNTPIMLNYCRAAKVSGNIIDNVIPEPTTPPYYTAVGIFVGTRRGVGIYREGAVTGTIEVTNNIVDMENDEPAIKSSTGIELIYATNIMGRFAGNQLKNNSRNGVDVLDVKNTPDRNSMVLVEDNLVVTNTIGTPTPTTGCPHGIVVGAYFLPLDSSTLSTQYVISHNYIEMLGAFPPLSIGAAINVLSNNVIIKSNHVVVDGQLTNRGIVLAGGSGCLVGENRIEGEGQTAIMVTPYANPNPQTGTYPANNNILKGNNYNNFTNLSVIFAAPILSLNVRYGADNNTLVGGHGTVLDLGIDNMIKGGFTSVMIGEHMTLPGGVGQEISEEVNEWGQINQEGEHGF
jgi:hypothetical protein